MAWTLERETDLAAPREEVFAFFADPANLEAITPPWLSFRLVGPPVAMREGARIRYRLRLHGVPVAWTSLVTRYDPPDGFVDVAVRSPYRAWRHEHAFAPIVGGTRVTDRVRYDHAGGEAVERLFVRPDLARIFEYRAERLAERFGRA